MNLRSDVAAGIQYPGFSAHRDVRESRGVGFVTEGSLVIGTCVLGAGVGLFREFQLLRYRRIVTEGKNAAY